MSAWLFQSMPEDFRLADYLKTSPEKVLWKVTRYGKKMLINDTVYIWQGVGKMKPPMSGIFARGKIIKCPHNCSDYETSAEYWIDQVNALKSMSRVLVAIEACTTSPAVSREEFERDPVLSECAIIAMSQGSNFIMTPEQANRLNTLMTASLASGAPSFSS